MAPRRRQCAAMEEYERLLEEQPSFRTNQRRAEEFTARAVSSGVAERVARRLVTIPTVVHVVHKKPGENISDAQVQSQLAVLNRDYRATNPDTKKVPAPWKGLVADAKIEFRLATKDPQGRPTDGIVRVQTDRGSFGPGDEVKRDSKGGSTAWPSDAYLNIWVCSLGGGLLGYAQFPGGPKSTDGVVVLNTAFGTKGTAAAPFNKGRTLTHEVGHWLNLRHIWGDTLDCGGGDRVPDTPNCEGPNYGTPKFPVISCQNGPHGGMFMNYMDYVDDAAMFMFTAGQVNRMNACLAGPRKSFATPTAL
ncbi:zinc metalloprotease [Nocardioides campestrisoli]|uniref:zinc metalloprotease n=1 Tax=Nocardioides campestrisoli TaxID=2736757 RepID=UPI002159C891|nr:zinc metalloprotease [Nocardioides campestrisoli]